MANAFDFDRLRRPPPEPDELPDAIDIEIIADNDSVEFDEKTGTVRIVGPDGDVTIEPAADEQETDDSDHFANLANKLSREELGRIADQLLRGIDLDDQSRHEWLETRSRGIDLMGLQLRQPSTAQVGGAQLEGTSKVNHPLLKEAVLRFQANARGELLPTDGPVKVRDDGEETEANDDLAQAGEEDLNHYVTTTATEYYPDTDRMLLWVGFGGCAFKKVYGCPIRRRPVSESIDAKDLIVSNAATDLKSCGRVTHRIMMRPSTVKRMQLLRAYREVPLPLGVTSTTNAVDLKIAETQGIQPPSQLDPQDRDREIYECYCELEVPGYEHKENGKLTGLALPWKVSIDKESREVLEVQRNWDADDDQCLARDVFVKYPFVPGFGFYDIGLLQILGDTTLAATAGWREMLDAGAFASFPGFLYVKALGKQLSNEFRIPPGGGMPIDLAGLDDIRKGIMPLPYSGPAPAMMQMIEDVVQTAQRVGGTAELPTGEGRQDAPVGTTLALIEQATKVLDAVHKRLHQAQSQEFKLLKERFMDDPEALWRHNKKSKVLKLLMAQDAQSDPSIAADEDAKEQAAERHKSKFVAFLSDCSLVPMADPNTSSQMHRYMKLSAMLQIVMGDPNFDQTEVKVRALKQMGIADVEALVVAPQGPPPPDLKSQAAMISAQAQDKMASAKLADVQIRAKTSSLDNVTEMQKMQNQKNVAIIGLAREQVIHQGDQEQAATDSFHQDKDRAADLIKHQMTLKAQQAQQANDSAHQSADRAADSGHQNADRAADLYKHHVDTMADLTPGAGQ